MDGIKKEVGEIVDRLAVIFDEEDLDSPDIQNEIEKLGIRLKELTGKTIEEFEYFKQYWSYTSLETVVEKILMPKVGKKGMSDEELTELIMKFCDQLYNPTMSEAEMDRFMEIIELESGLSNVSDYFYYPQLVGLERNPGAEAITKKILEDRKNSVIEL